MEHWKKLIRNKLFWLGICIVILCTVAVIICLPWIKELSLADGQEKIAESLRSFGIWTPFFFLLLQILHIVIAIIPGGPVPLIGGAVFGNTWGIILSLVGCFIGTLMVYGIVKCFGRPVAEKFVKKEHFEKFEYLTRGKRLKRLVFLIFLLPGLPKDMLTYIVALNPRIRPLSFACITTVARAPVLILTVVLGKSLWQGNWKIAVIIVAAMIALALLGLWMKSKISKKKEKKHGKTGSDGTTDHHSEIT